MFRREFFGVNVVHTMWILGLVRSKSTLGLVQPKSKKENSSLRFVVDGRASAGRKEIGYGRSPVKSMFSI